MVVGTGNEVEQSKLKRNNLKNNSDFHIRTN